MKNKNFKLDKEMSLILARLYKVLNNKKIGAFEKIREDEYFFPRLTLLVAESSNGINNKIRTLALLVQLIYLSTEIHSKIPESTDKDFLKNIQLPILTGDLLYSQFYKILCEENCLEYLDEFVEYITNLNLTWVDYLNGKKSIKDLCINWYGKLAFITAKLAATTSGCSQKNVDIYKKYGMSLGNFFGAQNLNISPVYIEEFWKNVNNNIDLIIQDEKREKLYKFALAINKNKTKPFFVNYLKVAEN